MSVAEGLCSTLWWCAGQFHWQRKLDVLSWCWFQSAICKRPLEKTSRQFIKCKTVAWWHQYSSDLTGTLLSRFHRRRNHLPPKILLVFFSLYSVDNKGFQWVAPVQGFPRATCAVWLYGNEDPAFVWWPPGLLTSETSSLWCSRPGGARTRAGSSTNQNWCRPHAQAW